MVCVALNSSIIYISEFYTGCISDKALTKESGFLDELPSYSTIRADNRFNIFDECTARNIDFIIPPGRRGASLMTPSDISKKSAIAKVRVLAEQDIRRIKAFKILATEMTISMLEKVDDIVLVCAAICNFKEPMCSD